MAKRRAPNKSEAKLVSPLSSDVSATFSGLRNEAAFSPERALQLGYVNLGDDHPRAREDKDYSVISASSEGVSTVAYPSTPFRRAHLDLYDFFIDDLPDFGKNNEGLLKVQVSTKDPQNLEGSTFDVAFATEFRGKDNSYAPTFLYRAVFRNVLLQDWINLKIELYELDTDASEYFQKIKGVVDKVPEMKNLDFLNGIPYLKLATQLFEGIVTVFGRNPDDHLWGELPVLELVPTPGGAFLRTGIYVLAEKVNSKKEEIRLDDLRYRNSQLIHAKGTRISNHLIFGFGLVEHTKP